MYIYGSSLKDPIRYYYGYFRRKHKRDQTKFMGKIIKVSNYLGTYSGTIGNRVPF